MVFNLSTLFPDHLDLSSSEDPFSHSVIDQVVASLPSHKSLGLMVLTQEMLVHC